MAIFDRCSKPPNLFLSGISIIQEFDLKQIYTSGNPLWFYFMKPNLFLLFGRILLISKFGGSESCSFFEDGVEGRLG